MNREQDAVPPSKPHISPSQIYSYLRCGEAYRRRYECREIIPPGYFLLRGKGPHKAAEVNFKTKMETREDLPIKTLVEVAVNHIEQTIAKEGFQPTKDEEAIGIQTVIGGLKDRVAILTRLFAVGVAPRIMPSIVEETIRINLPTASHDLLGRLDVATEDDAVVDLKTSVRSMNQAGVDTSDQLTFYGLAFQAKTGRPVSDLRLEILVDTKVPKVQTLSTDRTPRDVQVFVNKVNVVMAGKKAGFYLPAPAGFWGCSPRWCGYYDTCPYVNSERRAAAEE